ncbi:hypothetical protein MTO96_038476 [Rhipicephalus appendiculatus]
MAESQEQPRTSSMLAVAVDRLCDAFRSLLPPLEEIRALDSQYPWLAPLSGDSLPQAVDSIRHSLIAVQGEKHRLKRIATLQAWLIPRRVHKQWFLYNLNISSSTLDNVAFGEALSENVAVCRLDCGGRHSEHGNFHVRDCSGDRHKHTVHPSTSRYALPYGLDCPLWPSTLRE